MTSVRIETARSLEAGGTLARPAADEPNRHRLLLELIVLFVAVPVAMLYVVQSVRWPLFVLLMPVLVGLVVVLLRDPAFSLRRELTQGFDRPELRSMLAVFLVTAAALTAFVLVETPEQFLRGPYERPRRWLALMLIYPLMSVVTQELVYRTFFFHRYGLLFGDRRWLAIFVNGVLFGLGHLFFTNWVAVVATFALGLLLAYRYERTRSYWAVFFEHTLYGWLIFTVGLGGYFGTGGWHGMAEAMRGVLDTVLLGL